jgi:hypothetical protein
MGCLEIILKEWKYFSLYLKSPAYKPKPALIAKPTGHTTSGTA